MEEARSSKLKAQSLKPKVVKNRADDRKLGFEELEVWKRAIEFSIHVIDIIENLESARRHYRLIEQIEASVTSIAMNLAEGKGRFSKKEFAQFCYIARGSLYETITLLEIFRRKHWISEDDFEALKSEAVEIASMIKGLINALKRSL